ncbi:hypothetical protein AMTR_s00096p00150700 [Amborella trichopoda]|uniref:Uncharacterized protein n=1 Tax=Amborella trichopoda TaxID=13333 RepID=W1P631_AMBTC|nr:hypothetical protein AMTR_s00096p00150700 [Amborella trichopoda]
MIQGYTRLKIAKRDIMEEKITAPRAGEARTEPFSIGAGALALSCAETAAIAEEMTSRRRIAEETFDESMPKSKRNEGFEV